MAPTWLITGSSAGFGLAFVRYILARGHNVIATSRNPDKTPELVKEVTSNPNGRWLTLDVTSPKHQVEKTIQGAWEEFDGIDVLINNAGYSILGAAEDISEKQARDQFEVNFWGVVKTTQAILPLMRSRQSGTIVNISSVAGIDAQASVAIYAASKFALEAWSEGLSKELEPFSIRVLIVEPGAFRTNFFGKDASMIVPTSEVYKVGPVQTVLDKMGTMNGTQKGDPTKAAQIIFDVIENSGLGEKKKWWLRLPLGADSYARAIATGKERSENLIAVKAVAVSTDFDE